MIRFRRGIPFVSVVLVAAAVAIMLAAALTSWWVLLALIPLAMMVGCVAMMAAHRRMPRGPSAARCGCCAVSALSGATADRERKGANAVPGEFLDRPGRNTPHREVRAEPQNGTDRSQVTVPAVSM